MTRNVTSLLDEALRPLYTYLPVTNLRRRTSVHAPSCTGLDEVKGQNETVKGQNETLRLACTGQHVHRACVHRTSRNDATLLDDLDAADTPKEEALHSCESGVFFR
jgi:hypothetical protein